MRMIIWENFNALVLSHQQHGQKQQEKQKQTSKNMSRKKVKNHTLDQKLRKNFMILD